MQKRWFAAVPAAAALAFGVGGPAQGATNDPLRPKQWGLDRIDAEAAWAAGARGAGALVAVVDTGVDLGHPDLAGKLVSYADADIVEPGGTCTGGKRARTCVQDGAQDANGHGTHVAGIIGAATGNGVGVAGVAPDAKVLPVRVLDAEGSGTTDQIAKGIDYATGKGARVINLSLGFMSGVDQVVKVTGGLAPVYAAIDRARAAGAVVVVAAGNDGVPICAEPSGHPGVVCVGATDRNDLKSWYSNFGATSTGTYLTAPGGQGGVSCAEDVLSTYWRGGGSTCATTGYEALAGTSMAAPHVAGVAALLAGRGVPGPRIEACLKATADDLGTPGFDPAYGHGRVDAARAATCS